MLGKRGARASYGVCPCSVGKIVFPRRYVSRLFSQSMVIVVEGVAEGIGHVRDRRRECGVCGGQDFLLDDGGDVDRRSWHFYRLCGQLDRWPAVVWGWVKGQCMYVRRGRPTRRWMAEDRRLPLFVHLRGRSGWR